ncbi:MAG: aminoglycoside adenylyltransferase domain-containing protein [Anaerolineae bacterium]
MLPPLSCRALHTLETGRIVSKEEAARWAQAGVGAAWAGAIERALAWPDGEQPDDLAASLEMIHYTVERGRQHMGWSTQSTQRAQRGKASAVPSPCALSSEPSVLGFRPLLPKRLSCLDSIGTGGTRQRRRASYGWSSSQP